MKGYGLLLMITALLLMLIPLPWRIRLPRWAGYLLYPAHLALLIGLEYLMGKVVHWEHLTAAWQQLITLF